MTRKVVLRLRVSVDADEGELSKFKAREIANIVRDALAAPDTKARIWGLTGRVLQIGEVQVMNAKWEDPS